MLRAPRRIRAAGCACHACTVRTWLAAARSKFMSDPPDDDSTCLRFYLGRESCAGVDSFQCTGTFKEKTSKIAKPPQEFAGDSVKGQQSNDTAARTSSAHTRRALASHSHLLTTDNGRAVQHSTRGMFPVSSMPTTTGCDALTPATW